jgi:hypothetical protein
MNHLVEGIPHDVKKMVNQIKQFLKTFVEFQNNDYVDFFEKHIQRLRNNKDQYKIKALEVLKSQSDNNANTDPANGKTRQPQPHPPIFEVKIGNQEFVCPTYGNPMMTAFYSVMFVCFSMKLQAETAETAEECV